MNTVPPLQHTESPKSIVKPLDFTELERALPIEDAVKPVCLFNEKDVKKMDVHTYKANLDVLEHSERAICDCEGHAGLALPIGEESLPRVKFNITQIQHILEIFKESLTHYRIQTRFFNLSVEDCIEVSNRVDDAIKLCLKDTVPYSAVKVGVHNVLICLWERIRNNEKEGNHYELVHFERELDEYERLIWNVYHCLCKFVGVISKREYYRP